MKKTIIRRRKRVVAPANGNFTPGPVSVANQVQSPQQPQQKHSLADTEMTDVSQLQISSPHPYAQQRQQQQHQQAHRHFPPPVDFTTHSHTMATDSAIPMTAIPSSGQNIHATLTQANPQSQQRKRSLSQSMEDDLLDSRGHQSINSILNISQGSTRDVPIEPSLLALCQGPELTHDQKRQLLLEKRVLLVRESKRVKEELDNCTLELERLDESRARTNAAIARAAVAASAAVGED